MLDFVIIQPPVICLCTSQSKVHYHVATASELVAPPINLTGRSSDWAETASQQFRRCAHGLSERLPRWGHIWGRWSGSCSQRNWKRQRDRLSECFIFILIIYQVWKTKHENCLSNINGYCFHPVASKTKRCPTTSGLWKTKVHIYVITSFLLRWGCK